MWVIFSLVMQLFFFSFRSFCSRRCFGNNSATYVRYVISLQPNSVEILLKPFHHMGGRSLVGFLFICSDFLCVWYTGQSLPLSSHLCHPPQLFLAACSLIFTAGYI